MIAQRMHPHLMVLAYQELSDSVASTLLGNLAVADAKALGKGGVGFNVEHF